MFFSFFEKRDPKRPVPVNIPTDVYAEFRTIASESNDSVRNVIVRALREWLEARRRNIQDSYKR